MVTDAIAAYRKINHKDESEAIVERLRLKIEALKSEEAASVTAQIEGIARGVNPAIYSRILSEVANKRSQAEAELRMLVSKKTDKKVANATDAEALKSVLSAVEVALTSNAVTQAEKNDLIKKAVDTAWPEGDELHIQLKPLRDETVGLIVIRLAPVPAHHQRGAIYLAQPAILNQL